MFRLQAWVFIGLALLLSWLLMQAAHELGHAGGAWLTGGRVTKVVLHPLEISRTDVQPNPRPLVVVWAGPLGGILLPLAAWGLARAARLRCEYLFRFFAGFCLITNGAYIGFGSFAGIGDCGEMLRHGSPRWTLWLFGAITMPLGLALWNGLGGRFGLVENADEVRLSTLFGVAIALVAVVAAVYLERPLAEKSASVNRSLPAQSRDGGC